jgi:hypothetical protein
VCDPPGLTLRYRWDRRHSVSSPGCRSVPMISAPVRGHLWAEFCQRVTSILLMPSQLVGSIAASPDLRAGDRSCPFPGPSFARAPSREAKRSKSPRGPSFPIPFPMPGARVGSQRASPSGPRTCAEPPVCDPVQAPSEPTRSGMGLPGCDAVMCFAPRTDDVVPVSSRAAMSIPVAGQCCNVMSGTDGPSQNASTRSGDRAERTSRTREKLSRGGTFGGAELPACAADGHRAWRPPGRCGAARDVAPGKPHTLPRMSHLPVF